MNKKNRQLFVRIPPSNFPLLPRSTVAVVGYEIYFIGGSVDGAPSSTVRILDCRSHTWRNARCMNVARDNPVSCFYDGKIYVIGGFTGSKKNESWDEVFDTKTKTWERLSYPTIEVCKYFIFRIAEVQGMIYVFHNSNKTYVYDTKQGKWECSNNKNFTDPRPMCTCVIENVIYSCCYDRIDGHLVCLWYDTNAQIWRQVQGLNSLRDKHMADAMPYYYMGMINLVRCDGKLLIMWEVVMKCYTQKIWCTEIVVEKRVGDEVWGNVEWIDIMHSIPSSYQLSHLVAVSV